MLAALNGNGALASEDVFATLSELAVHLSRTPVSVVLVDIDAHSGMLAELDPIISRFPDARFVVLSKIQSHQLIVEAMQIGARHVLAKESIKSDLPATLQRIKPKLDQEPKGRLITVLSASGGCGATTVCVNLADELQLICEDPVLLVDLDTCYGALGVYLGIRDRYGIGDVLSHRGQIDVDLIRSTASEYSEGLKVLINPSAARQLGPLSLDLNQVDKMIEACRQAFSCTVIDAPRVPIEIAASLATVSIGAVIVFQLAIKDLHVARTIHTALIERGVSPERIILLANRADARHPAVSATEARKALGGAPIEFARSDYRSAIRSNSIGKPLSQIARRSRLRRDLSRLAAKLANGHAAVHA